VVGDASIAIAADGYKTTSRSELTLMLIFDSTRGNWRKGALKVAQYQRSAGGNQSIPDPNRQAHPVVNRALFRVSPPLQVRATRQRSVVLIWLPVLPSEIFDF
jgi:hypothetical protein